MKKIIAAALCVLLCAGALLSVNAARESTGNTVKDTFQDFLDTSRRLEELEKEPPTGPTEQTQPPTKDTAPTNPPVDIPVESVTFTTRDKIYLYPEKTYALKVRVLPENATDCSVTYQSSDKNVVTVDENGLLTAIAYGTARIAAKSHNGKTAVCTVEVVKRANSIAFAGSSYTIGKGESIRPPVAVTPPDAYAKNLAYTSSDPSVACVDEKGTVKGLRTGSATITAETANHKKASCKINVKNAPSSMTLNITSQKLFIGQTLKLKAAFNAGAAANILSYSSSNPAVASVDSRGVVTSKARGTAVISCKAYNGVSASCTITSRIVNYTKAYTSDEVYRDIALIAKQYPDAVTISSAGKSTLGQDLTLVKLGHGSKKALITGGIHSREHLTVTFTMLCLEEYAAAYCSKTGAYGSYNMKQLLNTYTLYIVPMMNPDGMDVVTKFTNPLYNYSGSRMEYKSNANGVNLNRNFPFYWGSITDGGINTRYTDVQKYKGPSAGSEVETQAIMNLCSQNRFEWLLSMHLRGNCLYWRDSASGVVPGDWELTQKLVNKCGYWAVETSTAANDYGGGLENWFRGAQGRPGLCVELVPSNIPSPTDNSSYHRDYVNATNWTKTKYTFVQGML